MYRQFDIAERADRPFLAVTALRMAALWNHLAFVRMHRGDISEEGEILRCHSDVPAYRFAIALTSDCLQSDLSADHAILVPSWLRMDRPKFVEAEFVCTHTLSYMLLHADALQAFALDPDVDIRRADQPLAMEQFTETQSRAFCAHEAALSEWAPRFRAAGFANLYAPSQEFLVSHDRDGPAACALSLYAESIAGIHAMGTRLEFRRRGHASNLVLYAVRSALERGFSLLGAQALADSPAEKLYSKIGFRRIFSMRVFARPRPDR